MSCVFCVCWKEFALNVNSYTTVPVLTKLHRSLHRVSLNENICSIFDLNSESLHWRSSHYTVTHVHAKNSNIQGRSPDMVKVIFHTLRNCS